MKELVVHTSTKKLGIRFIIPILGIIGLYVFAVVPDQDIGVGSGFYFSSLTVLIGAALIGLIIYYVNQLNISKSRPVLRISKEAVIFSRKKLKFPLSEEFSFTTPKDSILYVWRNDKRVKEINISWILINEKMLATFLNDLANTSTDKREALLNDFYQQVMSESNDAKKNIFFHTGKEEEEEVNEYNPPDEVDLSKQHKILGLAAVVLIVAYTYTQINTVYQTSFMSSFLISIFAITIVSAFFAILFSLIPYKKLSFKRKYLRSFLITVIGYSVIGFAVSLFSVEENNIALCQNEVVLEKLKARLIDDVSNPEYAPVTSFLNQPDSAEIQNVVNNQLLFSEIRFGRNIDADDASRYYNVEVDPEKNPEICECKATVYFKDNQVFLAKIKSEVRIAEKADNESAEYLSREHVVKFDDEEKYSFFFMVLKSEDYIEVSHTGYEISDLINEYIKFN